ncbi:site-specific integrase [Nocardia sp. NBC_00508]|uniref:tyrosine-type recombinase/integrase n=1 Tax=Nocardia sp. NBC_00508 TaxID=2975992 RepID=UPI002E7FE9CA|nr:tyrosine-type recombinase/integrase [Nocardia sp. NBC_00508]WUD70144.1 site-specific integrase [Nocardia sp. NBC_00508]
MLAGWERQQRGGRRLQPKTIDSRKSVIAAFVRYTNDYPWNWTASHLDEWMTSLIGEKNLSESTIRNYQGTVRQFCDYLTDPNYGWAAECERRFGTHPVQVCHEWNIAAHLVDYEGRPGRRPMTRTELQVFFDYADEQVDCAVRARRKGSLAAYRDATVFKAIYAWGLRRTEASRLDVVDFYRNALAPELRNFGMLHVRYGKRTKGSPPRRREVPTLMPWVVEVVEDYIENVRPRFGFTEHPALWVTERGGRLAPREINERFSQYRDALGLDRDLTPHCLRHSFVTHLTEDGVDPKLVQRIVGHEYSSTTAIYTSVSEDFMNTMMRKALSRAFTTEG